MRWNPLTWWSSFEDYLWTARPDTLASARTGAIRYLRLIFVLARDVLSGTHNLHAMSLVYTTLLSLVPLLALSFSVLKAFGVHNQIEPVLAEFLAVLGPRGNELTREIIGFVERINVGVLGSLGIALLLYTSVSLVQKLEESFNLIWHVASLRSMSERFSRYLSVLLVGPLLVFSALGLTAAALDTSAARYLLDIAPLGDVAGAVGRLIPYVLATGAFTFLYVFIPNARVRLGPAIAAGLIAGVLWQTAGWAFAAFIASSTHYAAIYSGFAVVVLFMIWVYVSWLILLFGASIAFYVQNPAYLIALPGEPRLSNRMRERLALATVSLIAGHYLRGRPPWTLQGLTEQFGIPTHALEVVLGALARGGVVAQTNGDPPAYLPARDLRGILVRELITIVRAAGEDRFLTPSALTVPEPVERVIACIEGGMDASLNAITAASIASDPAGECTAIPPDSDS